jgi:cob(I)alamin adenosyltransferase
VRDSEYYSRRGDDGYTGLLGPERVPKCDPRPEAYGTVDEVQAALGVARAIACTARTGEILLAIERDLHVLMAELAALGDAESPFADSIHEGHVAQLEQWVAEAETKVEMPKVFVVPGDSRPGAALHLARTVVRRAERRAVGLAHGGLLGNDQVLRYLNRLSSLLFALANLEDQAATCHGPTPAEG